jgi:hypothetical protein
LLFSGLLVISIFLFGCSDSNPVLDDNGSSYYLGGGVPDDGIDEEGKDKEFADEDKPDPPDIDEGKYSDSLIAPHLQFDETRGLSYASASGNIDFPGGQITASQNDDWMTLTVPFYNVSEETRFSITFTKGINDFNEELYYSYFTPNGFEFQNYAWINFQGEVNSGSEASATYKLYYNAAGTWIHYYTAKADDSGIVKFYIPSSSNYAILKEGGLESKQGDDQSIF